jgi:hypothetical protein
MKKKKEEEEEEIVMTHPTIRAAWMRSSVVALRTLRWRRSAP